MKDRMLGLAGNYGPDAFRASPGGDSIMKIKEFRHAFLAQTKAKTRTGLGLVEAAYAARPSHHRAPQAVESLQVIGYFIPALVCWSDRSNLRGEGKHA